METEAGVTTINQSTSNVGTFSCPWVCHRLWGAIALSGLCLGPGPVMAKEVTPTPPIRPGMFVLQKPVPGLPYPFPMALENVATPESQTLEGASIQTRDLTVPVDDFPVSSSPDPVQGTAAVPLSSMPSADLDPPPETTQAENVANRESQTLEGVSIQARDLIVPVDDLPVLSSSDLVQGTAAAVPLSPSPPADLDPTPETAQATDTPPPAEPSLAERSRLTGDWGGTRTQWEEAGITLDLEFTQYLQALASGGTLNIPPGIIPPEQLPRVLVNPPDLAYGGRLDGFIDLDTEKLGWWDGGKLKAHLEYNYSSTDFPTGLTFFHTNTGIAFPSGGPNVFAATSLYLSQQLGAQGSLLIGKINAFDLLENDPFFGGWGIHRFPKCGVCRSPQWPGAPRDVWGDR